MDLAVELAAAQAQLESLVGQHNQLAQTLQQVDQRITECQGVVKWLGSRIQADAPVSPPDEPPAAAVAPLDPPPVPSEPSAAEAEPVPA